MSEEPAGRKKKPRRVDETAEAMPLDSAAESPTPRLPVPGTSGPADPVADQASDNQILDDQASDDRGETGWDGAAESDEGFSLDDLGAAYAKAFAEHDPESFASVASEVAEGDAAVVADESGGAEPLATPNRDPDDSEHHATPAGIVEAALFVGHPKNESFSETRLASLMRDVTPEEVVEIVDKLNASYREQRQAIRITRDEHGYRMTVAPEVESVRRSFYGKVREARLSQAAVEVLALVAYQPGVTSQTVQDQRGHESGSILNQLVRRQLLEVRREADAADSKPVPRYYPTERFLYLFGLESLDDLPQVEESAHG